MGHLGPLPGPTQGRGLEARPQVGFWVNGAPPSCECGQSGLAVVLDRKPKPDHMLFEQSPNCSSKIRALFRALPFPRWQTLAAPCLSFPIYKMVRSRVSS